MGEIPAGYQGVRELGRGGMGVVWLAAESATGRPVVIKRLLAAGDLDLRRRFQREAEALAAVRHPAVLGIYTSGLDAAGPFLVLEYVEGVALDAILKSEGPRPIEEVTETLIAMAEGLAACHAADICHRDLKPANVLREAGSGRIVMVDFGLAGLQREAERLTMTGQLLGTPGYMAPEQLDGSSRLDAATDIWGLCATGYALLTGESPRKGTLLEMQTHHAKGKPLPRASELRPEVPDWLNAVLADGMVEDRESRPSATELSAALRDESELESRRQAREARVRRLKVGVGVMATLLFFALLLELPGLLAPAVAFSFEESAIPKSTKLERLELRGHFRGKPGFVEIKVDGESRRFTELRDAMIDLVVELGETEGARVVELRPTDGWGRALPVRRLTVIVDRTPPTATLDWSRAAADLVVSGQLEEDGVEVLVDGEPTPVQGQGFEATLGSRALANSHEIVIRDAAGNESRITHPPTFLVGLNEQRKKSTLRGDRRPDFTTLSELFKKLRTGSTPIMIRLLPGVQRLPLAIKRPVRLVGEPGVELHGDRTTAALEVRAPGTLTAIGLTICQPDTDSAPAIKANTRSLALKDCVITSEGVDVLVFRPSQSDAEQDSLVIEDCRLVRGGLYALRQLGGRSRIKGLEVRDSFPFQSALSRRGDVVRATGETAHAGNLGRYSVLYFGPGARTEIVGLDLRHVYDQAIGIDGAEVRLSDSSLIGYATSKELGTEAYGIGIGRVHTEGPRGAESGAGRLTAINTWIIEGKKALILNKCEVKLKGCRVIARNQGIFAMGGTSLELEDCLLAGHPAAREHLPDKEPGDLLKVNVNGTSTMVPTFSGLWLNSGPGIQVSLRDCRLFEFRGPPIMVLRGKKSPFRSPRKTKRDHAGQWPRKSKRPKLVLERVHIDADAKAPDISEKLGEWRVD